MSKPTMTDVRAVDPVLTNMLVGYMNEDTRFVADRAFPGVPVDSSEGTYFIFDEKYWMADDAKARAWGADYPEGGFGLSTGTYSTIQYASSHAIPDEVRADSQAPMDLEQAGAQRLAHLLKIRKERLWAAVAMAGSVWGTTATGGSTSTKWSTYASSDPVGDIRTAKRTISQSVAVFPNKLIMGEIVFDKLINHPDLIDRIKYTQLATVAGMEQALAAVLGVDQILVGAAIYNSNNEGQTGSYSAIVDDDALLIYTPPSPGLFVPSAGYTFNWAPGGGLGGVMPMYHDDQKDADVMKAKMQLIHSRVATGAGYFFSDYVD
jgi:hypothetical protein